MNTKTIDVNDSMLRVIRREACELWIELGLTPRQLADQRAELMAALERTRDWIRGDKWRFSDIPDERASWDKFIGDIDYLLARAKAVPK